MNLFDMTATPNLICKESLNTLIESLEIYINEVSKSNIEHYYMNDFQKCVLGVHMFEKRNWEKWQHLAIKDLTGIILTECPETWYPFDGRRYGWMNDSQWLVIRLFTEDVIDKTKFPISCESDELFVTKFEWLKQAGEALEYLKTFKFVEFGAQGE